MRAAWCVTGLVLALVAGCAGGDEASSPGGAAPARPVAVPARPRGLPVTAAPGGLAGTVAFHSDRAGRHKLFMIDVASGTVGQLTEGATHHDEDAAWSPDGRLLAFTTTRYGGLTYALAVMVPGQAPRRVAEPSAFDRDPAWSPDGRSLYFSSERDGTQAVYRVAADGSGAPTRLSDPPWRALSPHVSPDGRRLAYVVAAPEGFGIVTRDLPDGPERRLAGVSHGAVHPRWSPDGTRLLYTRLAPGGSWIEVFDFASSSTTALAIGDLAYADEAAWSPDGRWIVLAASRERGLAADWDLFLTAAVAPRAAHALTHGRGNDRRPAWRR